MSNRTLIELNHDYCPPAERIGSWAEAMVAYMRCGDRRELPTVVMHIEMRHHSELSVIETLRAQLASALEAQQKAERERDEEIECATASAKFLRLTQGQRDEARATIQRLDAEKREMREALGLSHEDWMSLSRAFNAVAYRHMSLPAEHRINEYLKVRISAALAGSPAAEGTKETKEANDEV